MSFVLTAIAIIVLLILMIISGAMASWIGYRRQKEEISFRRALLQTLGIIAAIAADVAFIAYLLM